MALTCGVYHIFTDYQTLKYFMSILIYKLNYVVVSTGFIFGMVYVFFDVFYVK